MEKEKKVNKGKEDYLKRLETSLMDAYNIVDNTVMYITQEYNKKMTFHVDLPSLYKLRKEYNSLISKNAGRKEKLKKIYANALSRLDKNIPLPDNILNKYLADIRNEFRRYMPDGVKYSEVLTWRVKDVVANKKEFKNMYSRINNLASFTSKRMMEAKKVFQKLLELSGYYVVKDTMENLDYSLEYEEISKLITECASNFSSINNRLKDGRNDFNAFINGFDKFDEEKLTLEVLQHIEKKIIDLLTPAYSSFLNNSKKYNKLTNVYNGEKPNLKREISKYRKKVEKIKKMILRNLYLKYNDLENVNESNERDTNVLGGKTDNMSLGDLILLDSKVTNELVKSKKEFIHKNYFNIICFYASNDILNKMPDMVYDVYMGYLENEKTYDSCFSVIKQQYFKCYYDTMYDMVIEGDVEAIDKASNNIKNNIERVVKAYMNLGVDMDEDILQMYRDKEKLDIISLYELYQKLKRNMRLFDTNKEVKFNK